MVPAIDAACMILRVDDVVAAAKPKESDMPKPGDVSDFGM